MNRICLKSPAKINLYLKVVGRRPDGYHEIQTLFQMVDLYDTLIFENASSGIELNSDATNIPLDENNLIYQAAKALMEYSQIEKGAHVFIEKKIPVAAGLGGGSSNAATTLKGLNDLWGLNLSIDELHNIAKRLGADIPFFLYGPTALGKGIGDIITPAKSPEKMPLVLINPNIPISARWAYANLELTCDANQSKIKDYLVTGEEKTPNYSFLNDLEAPVIKKYKIIGEIKSSLIQAGAEKVLMSGSGSTVFGVFSTLAKAKEAYRQFKSSNWTIFLTETISEKEMLN